MTNSLQYLCIGHLHTIDRQHHASFTFLTYNPTICSLGRTFCEEAEDGYKNLMWNTGQLTIDTSFAIALKDPLPTYKIYIGTINETIHFTVLATSQEECKTLLASRLGSSLLDQRPRYDFETILPVRNWHYASKAPGEPAKKMIQKFVPRVLECVIKKENNILVYVSYKAGSNEVINHYNHKLFVIETTE